MPQIASPTGTERKCITMFTLEKFVPLAFFKKEVYTGSREGMRYMVEKKEDQFIAHTYPEPFCFAATPKENIQSEGFPFTEEGRQSVVDWLNQQYDERKDFWDSNNVFRH